MAGSAADSGSLDVRFETTWGSNKSARPLEEGAVTRLLFDGSEEPSEEMAVLAGHASPEEQAILPGAGELASIAIFGVDLDGTVSGLTLVLPLSRLVAGSRLAVGEDAIAGGVWTIPPGAVAPDSFSPFTTGTLSLSEAGAEPGSAIVGSFSGSFVGILAVPEGGGATAAVYPGLVINEAAAKGDPLDWFELHNASSEAIALADFVVADDLKETSKRVSFPSELVVLPGVYLHIELDKDGWPGFALGGDEELGIWTADGTLVDEVDWGDGQVGEGESFARVPDAIGEFRTVDNPTPGAMNEAGN